MAQAVQAEATGNWTWSRRWIQTASGKYLQTDSPWSNWSGGTTHCWIFPLGTPGVESVTTIAFFLHVTKSPTSNALVSVAIRLLGKLLTDIYLRKQICEPIPECLSWANTCIWYSVDLWPHWQALCGLLVICRLHSSSQQDWLSGLSVCQLLMFLTLKTDSGVFSCHSMHIR